MHKIINTNKGTALIITMVYLIVVAIICVAVLAFSSGHYKLITQRIDRFQSFYYAEGGLYLGVFSGTRGNVLIDTANPNSTVDITNATDASGNISSKNSYISF